MLVSISRFSSSEDVLSLLLINPERGTLKMKKIDISRIPELKTSVGMQGSVKHKEVGGPVCLGALLGVAYMLVAG